MISGAITRASGVSGPFAICWESVVGMGGRGHVSLAEAQESLDKFCLAVGDSRWRGEAHIGDCRVLLEVNRALTRRVATPPGHLGDRGQKPYPPWRAISPKHHTKGPPNKVRGNVENIGRLLVAGVMLLRFGRLLCFGMVVASVG